jgi:hypothetical protein
MRVPFRISIIAPLIAIAFHSAATADNHVDLALLLRHSPIATILHSEIQKASINCSKSCSNTSCSRQCSDTQQCTTYCSGDGKEAYCECN